MSELQPESLNPQDSKPEKKTRLNSVDARKSIVKRKGKKHKSHRMHPNSLNALKKFEWPKGQSANPSGLPGFDVAAYVARRAFEQYKEEAIIGLGKQLKHGNAYVFKEMADRGYGKLKEKLELSGADEIATQLEAARKRSKGK